MGCKGASRLPETVRTRNSSPISPILVKYSNTPVVCTCYMHPHILYLSDRLTAFVICHIATDICHMFVWRTGQHVWVSHLRYVVHNSDRAPAPNTFLNSCTIIKSLLVQPCIINPLSTFCRHHQTKLY